MIHSKAEAVGTETTWNEPDRRPAWHDSIRHPFCRSIRLIFFDSEDRNQGGSVRTGIHATLNIRLSLLIGSGHHNASRKAQRSQ